MAVSIHGNNGFITTNGTAGAPSFAAPDNDTGLYFGTNLIHASTSGTERLRITDSGYLGIKRSTPLANLHTTNNELAIGANPTSAAAPNATYDGLVVDGEAASFINLRSRGDGNDSYCRLAFSDDVRSRAYVEYRHKDGDGDDTMRFATAGSERLRIDSGGRLLIGTTTNSSPIGWNNNLQVAGTNAQAGISIRRDENGTGGALLVFGKSRGSLNGNTVVQSGDQIGGMYFAGADGTDVNSIAAQISVEVDGTPGSDDMPGRLIFKTTADGAASPTERLRITSAGAIGIAGANYGSSGQVLTSGGSSAAVSWATPSSSLTSQSVQAEQVTDQTMGTGAWNLVKFNAQNWDTGNNYNHATGEWYYQAPSDGKYWYKASAKLIDLGADKEFDIALYKSTDNGGSYTIQKKSQRWVFTRENTASVVIVETTGLMDLDEDDRIRVYTWHNHGSDRDLDDNFTLFEVFRLGD